MSLILSHPRLLAVATAVSFGLFLLLVVLSVTLWGKWIENRDRADRLSAELKKVYVEAEKLRSEGAAAKQRIAQLERQLHTRPGSRGANGPTPAAPR